MNNMWMFAIVLLVVAIVPFALLGAIRLVAWAAPAQARWAIRLEREHFKAYWYLFGATYLFVGIVHFVKSTGEPVFGTAFTAMGVLSLVRAVRGRRESPATPDAGRRPV